MKKLLTALVVMFAMTLSACCKPGVQSGWCNAQKAVVDGAGDVYAAVKDCGHKWWDGKLPGLLKEVEKVLVGGAPDYKAQLDGLKVDGISVAVCVVKEFVKLQTTPVTTTRTTAGLATKTSALTVKSLDKAPAVLRGLDYLGTKAASK